MEDAGLESRSPAHKITIGLHYQFQTLERTRQGHHTPQMRKVKRGSQVSNDIEPKAVVTASATTPLNLETRRRHSTNGPEFHQATVQFARAHNNAYNQTISYSRWRLNFTQRTVLFRNSLQEKKAPHAGQSLAKSPSVVWPVYFQVPTRSTSSTCASGPLVQLLTPHSYSAHLMTLPPTFPEPSQPPHRAAGGKESLYFTDTLMPCLISFSKFCCFFSKSLHIPCFTSTPPQWRAALSPPQMFQRTIFLFCSSAIT